VNRFRTVAITALAGLVLVACGSSSSASPSQAGAASQAAQKSQAAQGSGAPAASFGAGVVAELEALIPDKVSTTTMTKSSFRGNDYLIAPGADPQTIKFLNDVGVSPSDIAMAIGSGFDQASASAVFVFIVRAKGGDSNKLLTAFEGAMNANASSPLQWTNATVGGKQVQSAPGGTGNTYVYAKGDTVFWVIATKEADAVTVLGGLP
jgi:hypothetical protein